MLAVVYLFCKTLKTLRTGDRALVRSVACCDSYWCMILHPWEFESAFCALCAISPLPRVLLSCYFTGVTCSRGIGAPFMQAWNGVLGHEMPQTRPSGGDFMLKCMFAVPLVPELPETRPSGPNYLASDPQRSFASLRMTERRSGWQRCAQDDRGSLRMTEMRSG